MSLENEAPDGAPSGAAEAAGEWEYPAEARRTLDPLLECLVALSRFHGLPQTRDAFTAGLPLVDSRLTPSLFQRAARRAGLSSKIARRRLGQITEHLLPVVLLLQDGQACLLVGWENGGETARVVLPELPESTVTLSHDELELNYTGLVIYARPQFRFDRRAPEVGKVRGRHWFWGAMAENLPVYRDVLLAAALVNVFALAMPLFTMNVYNRVVPNNAVETLWLLTLGVLLVLLADFGLRMLRGYFVNLAGSRVDVDLSARIMERVLGIRMESRPSSAGSFAATLRSFESVRDFIASATLTTIVDLPFTVLFLAVMAWIDWVMFLPCLVGMLVVVGYAWLVQGKMHDLAESTHRSGAMRNAGLVESLVGLETVKSLGAEGVMQRRWERSGIHLARVSTQMRLLAASTVNGTSLILQLVTLAVLILGVYRSSHGLLSMGGMVACTMLASRAMNPFGQVASLLTQYHGSVTALESLNQLMVQEVERPPEANFVSRPVFHGDIEFREVCFAYPGQESDSLRNVSLRIQAGEHVAILGRVGSGKTTLLKLILGLYRPTAGSVHVDGADIRQLDPAELRRNIGYVPQDGMLFYGSLRENITLACPEVDDAHLLRAAELGGIREMVDSHPRGFDMLVGERGESLSGGQRQGVSIARAMVGEPPILLLDEPTGFMDHTSEELVKRNLREYSSGHTLLVVTHRTSLLDLADRVIVMDHGRVVADGPKAQVLEALRQGRIERAK